MTLADYLAIRERLDHPRVIVWDLCAVTLAKDDSPSSLPEWEQKSALSFPNSRAAYLAKFPIVTRIRWSMVVAGLVLIRLEAAYPLDLPRTSMQMVARWLSGGKPSVLEFDNAGQVLSENAVEHHVLSQPRGYLDTFEALVVYASRGAKHMQAVERYPSGHKPDYSDPNTYALADPETNANCNIESILFSASHALNGLEQEVTAEREALAAHWWARCRALLPIADVTTAEIEWGDIELPPRPLADDLPGDGGDA